MEEEKKPPRLEMIIAVGVLAIGLPTVGLAILIFSSLGLDRNTTSAFLSSRTLLLIVYAIAVIPASIFGEYFTKEWKKRRFSWRSVTAAMGVFTMLMGSMILVSTLLNEFFSKIDITWQLLLAMACNSWSMVPVALFLRTKRFEKFAREKLGW